MRRLWFDLETRSPVPITEGTYRYAEQAEVLLFIYAVDDGPVQVYEPLSQQMPQELHEVLSDPRTEMAAHNVAFDRTILLACGYKYPLHASRFFCTMTAARMVRLPGSLDQLCRALGLPDAYSKRDGNKLIKRFCIPNALNKFTQPADAPGEWKRFVDYAIHDVVAMRECMKRIPNVMNEVERGLYTYTALMNDRGVLIDRTLAVRATFNVTELKAKLRLEARRLADDAEFNVVSQQALLAYLKQFGIELVDARQATLEAFVESEQASVLPGEVLALLRTRLKTSKAAVAKYPTVLKRLNRDDRLRGLIAHAGAGNTHRDSSVGPQFQNLARPVWLDERFTMEEACQIAKDGTAEFYFDDPLQLYSDCVRGLVIPAAGHKLCVADLSNIEGRSIVWLANEEWKLKYFRDFDEKKIRFDNYVAAYAKAFNIAPSTVTKDQRQVGKVMELAFSFGGSTGAFITFAAIYRVDLDKMARSVRETADSALWADCESGYDWFNEKGMTYGISKDTWTGCYYLVKAWRAAHPQVVAMWEKSEVSMKNAINNPGVWFEAARGCHFYNDGGWMYARLPSGRMMVFPMARIEEGANGREGIVYMGVNSFTKKFGVQRTYGGRLAENWTQSFARDVLLWNVPMIEQEGYPIVARIHDELITEPPDNDSFSGARLAALMSTRQQWCPDLPLAATGEDLYRYQK